MPTMHRRPRVIKQLPILYVNEATMIPDGMHAFVVTDDTSFATEPVVQKLVVNGMPSAQARSLVYRTARKIQDGGMGIALMVDKPYILDDVFRGLLARGVEADRARVIVTRAASRAAGLGDAASDAAAARLAQISDLAKRFQASHQAMIASMASWEEREPGWMDSDDNLRLTFQDQLTGMQTDFVNQALPILGVQFPYQIDRTDPAGAIVLAVRDDIQNTADLLDQRKSQQLLGKQIADLSSNMLPSSLPSFPGLPNVPWYVWAGGAGVGLLALKEMLK